MKIIAPDYYNQFVCIADRCRHSCCIGWEIDVDEEALARYRQLSGPMGEELRRSIAVEDGTAHFILGPEERCPFLNERGLCRMILGLGEDALCQICTDHPRYRNFFSDREELGLGLCCEAAAALILGQERPAALTVLEDDGREEPSDAFELLLLRVRDRALELVRDRSLPLEERIHRLLSEFKIRLPERSFPEWAGFYLSLERMDEDWTALLERLRTDPPGNGMEQLPVPFEQLLSAFLYRHLPSAQDETDFTAYIAFAVLSCRMISALCPEPCSFSQLVELVRLYSSEVEYSEENTEAVVALLWQENN